MIFKEKLDMAITVHYDKHKEIITTVDVANALWPDSSVGSRRSSMSQRIGTEYDIKASQIRILMELFPDTTAQFWVDK